ncbi:MAG: hypothetical protein JOZ02_11295 [Acidobacteria bacterium]|nr:hypothetical protein [Acidobacteriota bacterium]
MRFVVLSVAAGALTSAAVKNASGRQTPQPGVGNSAEAARLERERRDREMREADLSEREFLLRNMKPDRRPAEKPAPRLALAQLREDFLRLQVLNNDLARAASRGGDLDPKFVSKSAAEIRRLAARLRDNLALPAPAVEGGRGEAKAAPPPAQLGPALSELDGLILKFVNDVASKGVYLLDAQSSAKARQELEAIIELSARVKKACETLGKSTSPPR